jgi:hypothetical protein
MSLFSVPCRSHEHFIFYGETLNMHGECTRIEKVHFLETCFVDKPAVLEDKFYSLVKFSTFHYKITWVLRRKLRSQCKNAALVLLCRVRTVLSLCIPSQLVRSRSSQHPEPARQYSGPTCLMCVEKSSLSHKLFSCQQLQETSFS